MEEDKILTDVMYMKCNRKADGFICRFSYLKSTLEGKLPTSIENIHTSALFFGTEVIKNQHIYGRGIEASFYDDIKCVLRELRENKVRGIDCLKERK